MNHQVINHQVEFNKIITSFSASFPKTVTKEFLLSFYLYFDDCDLEILKQSIKKAVAKRASDFFPSPSQILEEYKLLEKNKLRTYFTALPNPEIPEQIKIEHKNYLNEKFPNLARAK